MNNVIGSNLSNTQRIQLWNTMVNYRKAEEVFKNTTDPWELRVLNRQRNNYKKFLKEYTAC